MKTDFDPIKIVYRGIDGASHEAFIQPLKRRDGVEVLHLVLSAVGASLDADTLGAVAKGDNSALIAIVGRLIKSVSFDDMWKIANKLLRFSVIDLKECNDLDQFDGFNGHFADVYSLVFEALKVNYPDFFGMMGRKDSEESIVPKGANQ